MLCSGSPLPVTSSHQPGTPARQRLHSYHLLSWLHCLATACPCLFSTLEEEEEAAFLHGPSGRSGLARAWPHDGFTDYNFLMWGLLSHVADPIPSAVCFLKELREGETPHAACSHWQKRISVQAGVGGCARAAMIVHTRGNLCMWCDCVHS